mgnify:CR=1 FL=1
MCSYGVFFFQAEDGIRDLVRSRGLGDVYKRQGEILCQNSFGPIASLIPLTQRNTLSSRVADQNIACLLYTSDAADERSSVDLGGRRIIKKKDHIELRRSAKQRPYNNKAT